MNHHSAIQRSLPAWKEQVMEKRLSAIGDFVIGVGGVRKGDTVADVSACNGFLSPRLRQLGARVLMVERWRSLSTQTLPVASGSVDVLFVHMVLHHMRFPTQAIADMKRVLKPGGRLVITDLRKYEDVRAEEDPSDRWMGFYTSDIRHWLWTSGFSNIIVNPIPYGMLGLDMDRLGSDIGSDIFIATGTA